MKRSQLKCGHYPVGSLTKMVSKIFMCCSESILSQTRILEKGMMLPFLFEQIFSDEKTEKKLKKKNKESLMSGPSETESP